MENNDLLSVLKFILLKIQEVDVKLSALQMILYSRGISSPEHFEQLHQQLADSPETLNVRTAIRTLGPYDVAIAQILEALESSDK